MTLAADATQIITVNCTIPPSSTTVINNATSQIDLKATVNGAVTAANASLNSNDVAGTVETVLADDTGTSTDGADRNASHSAVNTYTVQTASLSVNKTSVVTADPFNGT